MDLGPAVATVPRFIDLAEVIRSIYFERTIEDRLYSWPLRLREDRQTMSHENLISTFEYGHRGGRRG